MREGSVAALVIDVARAVESGARTCETRRMQASAYSRARARPRRRRRVASLKIYARIFCVARSLARSPASRVFADYRSMRARQGKGECVRDGRNFARVLGYASRERRRAIGNFRWYDKWGEKRM